MPAPGKPARKSAAATKAAAARAEVNGTSRSIDFRGLQLTLPKALPATLYFDLAELEDEDSSIAAQVRLLRSVIGDEQVRQVRRKLAEDQVPFEEVDTIVIGLFQDALAAYGTTVPESEASPRS